MNSPQRIPEEKIEELLARLIDRGSAKAETLAYPSVPLSGQGPDCPEDAVWQRFAVRQFREGDSRGLIDHAAGCQRCGAILNFWTSVLSGEETSEESSALAGLASQGLTWQQHMTDLLCTANQPATAGWFGHRGAWPAVLGFAGAIAAAALFFLFMGTSHSQAAPERLLAEAYSGHRIMETRIPMAEFAPVDAAHHTRAAGASPMSDSVPLLEARAAITQALMKTPEDAHWLLLQARSDLLNENYDTAIDTLKRLHAGDPANVAVLTDLASAYLMRSRATESPTDEATALDYLEQAARLEPQNPVVLYNEALVLQDLFQYANAIDVWKRFLAVEHDPAWAADGKRRLAEIEAREAKVKAQQSRLELFLANPEGMLHLARSPAKVAEYDEELSTDYLPLLLKTAFPVTPPADSSASNAKTSQECVESCRAARLLLQSISASLEKHHGDRWLSDLLAGSGRSGFAANANILANAIADGMHANAEVALSEAQNAQEKFRLSGNTAGVAVSGAEQLYDLEHLLDPRECLAAAHQLRPLLTHKNYPLIGARFWADEATCHLQQNDFAAVAADLHRSLRVSAAAGYRIIHLRAYGFLASNEEAVGSRSLAWKMNMQGLRTYWEGDYPAIRRAPPYVFLARGEMTSSRFYSSVLLHREVVDEAALFDNPTHLNANRFLLVKAEIRAGEMREAARDLGLAEAELASLPNHNALRGTAADIGIFLAEAYLARNDLPAAAGMLRDVVANMSGTGNRDMELRYSAADGRLAMLQGQPQRGEDELSHAVAVAELGYRETRGMQDRKNWIEGARKIYADLALLRLREGRPPLQALAIWERYRILSSGLSLEKWCHEDNLDCLAGPLDAARQTLKQETVLGSIRLDRSLLLWTMDDRGVQMHEVAIEPDRFDLLCHTFTETLASPASSEPSIRFYGSRLAASLLAPVASALDPQRTLVFDLDDSMEFLPVPALPWSGGFLGLQFAISTVHSVLLANQEPPARQASQRSLVVGASDPGDPEVPPLPEARTEALAVAEFLARPKVFLGEEAQASSIEAAAPRAGLIHFAGHTRFAEGGTRLLLAQPVRGGPDWLDARAFQSHAFANCRLVVLSACSTGQREERGFDDIQDIAQTLIADGAQQVIATHWDVDSAASVLLMKRFYSGLVHGLAVPQALLQAERAVSATAEYQHPYYWAPYYATGMGKSKLKELFHDDSEFRRRTTGFPGRKPI